MEMDHGRGAGPVTAAGVERRLPVTIVISLKVIGRPGGTMILVVIVVAATVPVLGQHPFCIQPLEISHMWVCMYKVAHRT